MFVATVTAPINQHRWPKVTPSPRRWSFFFWSYFGALRWNPQALNLVTQSAALATGTGGHPQLRVIPHEFPKFVNDTLTESVGRAFWGKFIRPVRGTRNESINYDTGFVQDVQVAQTGQPSVWVPITNDLMIMDVIQNPFHLLEQTIWSL